MKNLITALSAAIFASVLTVVALELVRDERGGPGATNELAAAKQLARPPAAATNGPAAPRQALATPSDAELEERLVEMDMRFTGIEAQLGALAAERHAMPGAAAADTIQHASLQDTPEARELVLDVLQEQRDAEAAARAERRAQQAQEALQRRASKIAQKLDLMPRDQEAVFNVLNEQMERSQALRETLRASGGMDSDARQLARDQMKEIRTWKSEELTRQLGPELAQQVLDLEKRDAKRDERDAEKRDRRRRGGD